MGEGANVSAFGAIDLANDNRLFEHDLMEGSAQNLAILPRGRVLVSYTGKDRLLEYSARGILRVTREMGDYGFPSVYANDQRAVVMSRGTPLAPILEYKFIEGMLAPSPCREFSVDEGEIGGLAILPCGGLAVSLCKNGQVLLLGDEQAQPFSGFAER